MGFLYVAEQAVNSGQDLRKKHEFRDQSWLGLKTRSRDPTLSRHKGININELYLHTKIAQTATGKTTSTFSMNITFKMYLARTILT